MKRRIIALILVTCLCFCTMFTGQIASAAKMRGDINFDEFINTKDSLLLKRHLAERVKLAADALIQADCNNDGKIDLNDVNDLINYLVKTGELHIDLAENWCTLYDWETLSDGSTASSVTTILLNQATMTARDLLKHTVANNTNPYSDVALALKPYGLYYKNTSSRASLGRNPTVGVDYSASIKIDTTKTVDATNLRVLLNFAPANDELAVIYIGFMYKDLQKYYYRITPENYSDFNYFYFADKEYTKFVKGYRRTYLEDEEITTLKITKDDIKDIKYIYFWMESDNGLNTASPYTQGLIVDDIEYFEGVNGYDSSTDDAALPTPAVPKDDGTDKYIAISFDDGPQVYSDTNRHFMDYYIDLAEEYDAKFSYFLIGSNCDNSDIPTLKRAVEAGHALENHTINHDRLSVLTVDEAASKITGLNDWLLKNVGVTTNYLRPPFLDVGYGDNKVYQAAKQAGIKACISGPCPGDYDEPSVDYEELFYEKELGDGSISLMHEHYIDNVEMVRRVLEHFSARGYKFVTIDELFKAKGVEPVCDRMYSVVR